MIKASKYFDWGSFDLRIGDCALAIDDYAHIFTFLLGSLRGTLPKNWCFVAILDLFWSVLGQVSFFRRTALLRYSFWIKRDVWLWGDLGWFISGKLIGGYLIALLLYGSVPICIYSKGSWCEIAMHVLDFDLSCIFAVLRDWRVGYGLLSLVACFAKSTIVGRLMIFFDYGCDWFHWTAHALLGAWRFFWEMLSSSVFHLGDYLTFFRVSLWAMPLRRDIRCLLEVRLCSMWLVKLTLTFFNNRKN